MDKLWSSDHMYLHLAALETGIPKHTDAACRALIDTFFFRASTMLGPGKSMVLSKDQDVPATTISSPPAMVVIPAFTGYAAVVASHAIAAHYLHFPEISTAKLYGTGFFNVTIAKSGPLCDHIPRALCQLYVCGKQLGRDVIRGVITNGYEWMFIILSVDKDGERASYKFSATIQYNVSYDPSVRLKVNIHEPWPDILAGTLAHWAENCFDDLNADDDWFEE